MLGKATICLSMIVRDEAHVIERCLDSVLPYITSWVIADTGSTDGTQDLIRAKLAHLPGELRQDRWFDFSTNRNLALLPALRMADYALVIDADETLGFEPWYADPELVADCYFLQARAGHVHFPTPRLLRNTKCWSYVGVLHEVPECPGEATGARLHGAYLASVSSGARARDPDKFRKDAALLRRALEDDPDNARYRFYLAQTLKDGEDYPAALDAYRAYLALPEDATWAEERYYARLNATHCRVLLGCPWPEALAEYLDCFAAKPDRAEPLYAVGMQFLQRGEFHAADLFLSRAAALPIPIHAPLYADLALHRLHIPLHHALCCQELGRYGEALATVNRLLGDALLPADLRELLLHRQGKLLARMGAAPD